jgi:hypothetical protein
VGRTVEELRRLIRSENGAREPTICVLPHGHLTVPQLKP